MSNTTDGLQSGKLLAPKRNNYFFGQLLDENKLFREQDYFKDTSRLINRLGLGSGVLCGLEITPSRDAKQLCLSPGVAVDPFGRVIIVPEVHCFDPRQISDCCGQVMEEIATDQDQDLTISICYHECFTDFSPMMVSDCNTREQCAPGTVIESFCVQLSKKPPAKIDVEDELCKALNASAKNSAERRKNLSEATSGECPAPSKAMCVILGTVKLKEGRIAAADIDTDGCRTNVYSNSTLLDMILCLAERRGGTGGGPPGRDGVSVKSADAVAGTPVSAAFDAATGNIHFVIPPGPPGANGAGVKTADAVTGRPVSAAFDATTGNIHFVIPPGTPGADGVSVRSADAVEGTAASASFNTTTGNIHFVIPPGASGVSVKSADAETGTPVSASFDATTGNIHFVIPPGTGLNPNLTKIVNTSWVHEGAMSIDDFMSKGLQVFFSAPINATSNLARGWFLVTVEYPILSQTALPPYLQSATIFPQRVLEDSISIANDAILFMPNLNFRNTFDKAVVDGNLDQSEQKILCRVVVKCNYLCDKKGSETKDDVVDGDFLKNMFPTGDGVPGGDFESWFVLEPSPNSPIKSAPQSLAIAKRSRRTRRS